MMPQRQPLRRNLLAAWAFQNTRQITGEGLGIFFIPPADAFPTMDSMIGGMNGLTVSSARRYPVNSMSLLAPHAPEGNPWAPIAYQFSGGPTYRPFCLSTLAHQKAKAWGQYLLILNVHPCRTLR
ncbi:hypothetical protein FSHL1_006190 [Fusarium sambucinum]